MYKYIINVKHNYNRVAIDTLTYLKIVLKLLWFWDAELYCTKTRICLKQLSDWLRWNWRNSAQRSAILKLASQNKKSGLNLLIQGAHLIRWNHLINSPSQNYKEINKYEKYLHYFNNVFYMKSINSKSNYISIFGRRYSKELCYFKEPRMY